MTDMREFERKYRMEDPISDLELKEGIEFFKNLSSLLNRLGERWAFARNEACNIYNNIERWQRNRQHFNKAKTQNEVNNHG